MNVQERFAFDWGIDQDRVGKIVLLAQDCKLLNEKSCNGDTHPRNRLKPEDKNENSRLWAHDCNVATAELLRYVEAHGFTGIEYNGLGPTLKRGDQYVEIPW